MAGFDVGSVEKLDYDFTGITRDDGEGFCSGKGIVPEPSNKRLQEFQRSLLEYTKERMPEVSENGDRDIQKELAAALEAIEQDAADRETMTEILSDLTKGAPSKEEIDELPPRYFTRFFQYVYEGVSPEASSAVTRV